MSSGTRKALSGVVLALAMLSGTIQAQTSGAAAPAAPQWPAPEQVVDSMASKLGLNADQKSQMIPIIADRQQKLRALREDASLSRWQRMRQSKQIMSDSDRKIDALLSAQQQQQYAEIEREMRQQFRQRMQSR